MDEQTLELIRDVLHDLNVSNDKTGLYISGGLWDGDTRLGYIVFQDGKYLFKSPIAG